MEVRCLSWSSTMLSPKTWTQVSASVPPHLEARHALVKTYRKLLFIYRETVTKGSGGTPMSSYCYLGKGSPLSLLPEYTSGCSQTQGMHHGTAPWDIPLDSAFGLWEISIVHGVFGFACFGNCHLFLRIDQSATGNKTVPTMGLFHSCRQQATLAWYLPVRFPVAAEVVFSDSLAN